MFYKHWKKIALALTGFFWASCDNETTSANGAEEPNSSSSVATPESSAENQESSSSTATENQSLSSSSEATPPESSSSFENIMPAYGVPDDPLLSSSSLDSIIAQPLYGVREIFYVCEQAEGDSTMNCGDGATCTERTVERWKSPSCSESEDPNGEIVSVCPEYGVVRISEKTYECDGKIYNEAEFRSRYEKMVVKKKIEPIDTSFTQPIALYGTPNIVKVYPNKDDQ